MASLALETLGIGFTEGAVAPSQLLAILTLVICQSMACNALGALIRVLTGSAVAPSVAQALRAE